MYLVHPFIVVFTNSGSIYNSAQSIVWGYDGSKHNTCCAQRYARGLAVVEVVGYGTTDIFAEYGQPANAYQWGPSINVHYQSHGSW